MKTGFWDLDWKVKFEGGKLIVLGSRPAMGKSTLALNIATNIAVREKMPILYFNLELSKESIIKNIITSESVVNRTKFDSCGLEENDWVKISQAMLGLKDANIYIDDTPGISIEEICKKSRKMRKENGIKFILIDYIQLISYDKRELLSREQEISMISLKLKELSRELDIPIFVLTQLSRDAERREEHRPIVNDMRDCGSLSQDADVILFLFRDDYYNLDSESKDIAEVIIAKNRGGQNGTIELLTLFKYCKFVNLERRWDDQRKGKINENKCSNL